MGEPTVSRVSDRDREAAVELPKDHAVAGRLTVAEPARRTERAERAETTRDLEALTSDLPVERPASPPAGRRASLVSILGDVKGEGPGGRPPPRAPTVRIAVWSFFGDLRVSRQGA